MSHGETFLVEEEKNRWRRRMYDLSEFIKTFKEEFRRAFQREYDYSGRLWGDRFFSTLIGSSAYLMRCAAYIDLCGGLSPRGFGLFSTHNQSQDGRRFIKQETHQTPCLTRLDALS